MYGFYVLLDTSVWKLLLVLGLLHQAADKLKPEPDFCMLSKNVCVSVCARLLLDVVHTCDINIKSESLSQNTTNKKSQT